MDSMPAVSVVVCQVPQYLVQLICKGSVAEYSHGCDYRQVPGTAAIAGRAVVRAFRRLVIAATKGHLPCDRSKPVLAGHRRNGLAGTHHAVKVLLAVVIDDRA
jgi:hypothetical protein